MTASPTEPDGSHVVDHNLTPRRAVLAGIGGLAAGALLNGKARAGDLDPPAGPITPTMKRLDEVEPRTAINATNTPGDANSVYKITQPGSYYLTGNIGGESGKHGIEIAASNVSIDLNGFALIGVPGSLDGVTTEGLRHHLVIRNGTISNWGSDGINLTTGGLGTNCIIEGVVAASNSAIGIRTNNNAVIRGCLALSNGSTGFNIPNGATISDCAARTNTGNGFVTSDTCTITNCVSRGNTSNGFTVLSGCTITGCSALANGGDGIGVFDGSTISNCTVVSNTGNGVQVASDCSIRGNTCKNNGVGAGSGAGILATSSDNLIEHNNCTDNTRGIECTASGNFIARNVCSGNSTNWVIAASNKCLVVNGANAGAINGNAGGTSPGSSDPNANYTY